MRINKPIWKNLGAASVLVILVCASFFTVFAAVEHDLTSPGSSTNIGGTIILQFDPANSAGSGNFNTFLAVQNSPSEKGYNSDASPPNYPEFDESASKSDAITLSAIPQTVVNGIIYREFQLDLNEANSTPLISLDALQVFTASSGTLFGYNPAGPDIGGVTDLIWDMDASQENEILMDYSLQSGSGEADYIVLVPEALFNTLSSCAGNPATCYVYLYCEFGGKGIVTGPPLRNWESDAGFDEWGVAVGDARINPGITIEKSTNGQDADSPTGPIITTGDLVTWEYVIENTGDVLLENVEIIDDNGTPGDTNDDFVVCSFDSLPVGVTETCSYEGIAKTGQYGNLATVNAEYAAIPIADDDPSHYLGEYPTSVLIGPIALTFQAPDAILVEWLDDNTGGPIVTGYNIFRSSTDARTPIKVNTSKITVDLGPGTAAYSFIDNSVQKNTTYQYYVQEVYNGAPQSELQGPESITTGMLYLPLVKNQ
jgi:hypothetical protein